MWFSWIGKSIQKIINLDQTYVEKGYVMKVFTRDYCFLKISHEGGIYLYNWNYFSIIDF